MDNKIIEANIRLQDMNKILEKENAEYKSYLLASINILSKYVDDEQVYYLLKDIKEVLKIWLCVLIMITELQYRIRYVKN